MNKRIKDEKEEEGRYRKTKIKSWGRKPKYEAIGRERQTKK